jgi:hypothetical protein
LWKERGNGAKTEVWFSCLCRVRILKRKLEFRQRNAWVSLVWGRGCNKTDWSQHPGWTGVNGRCSGVQYIPQR